MLFKLIGVQIAISCRRMNVTGLAVVTLRVPVTDINDRSLTE